MKTTPIIKTRSILLSAMLLAFAAPLAAQDASAGIQFGPAEAASPQRVSAEAQAIIDRMTAYLRGLPAFSIDSQTTRDEVLAFGYKMQNNESAKLVVKQPNKLRVEVNGDIRNRTYVYDGANFTMYSPEDAVFTRTAAPDSLKKLICQRAVNCARLPFSC